MISGPSSFCNAHLTPAFESTSVSAETGMPHTVSAHIVTETESSLNTGETYQYILLHRRRGMDVVVIFASEHSGPNQDRR